MDGVLGTDVHANTHEMVEKGECIIEGQESKTQNKHSN